MSFSKIGTRFTKWASLLIGGARGRRDGFSEIAPFYDRLMAETNYEHWARYYRKILEHQKVRPKRILDVCCGTGNMTELMYRAGFDMVGIDVSVGMIQMAEQKARRKKYEIEYRVEDATRFRLGARFDADATRNAYSRASEVIRMARGRLRGELAMPDAELGADS